MRLSSEEAADSRLIERLRLGRPSKEELIARCNRMRDAGMMAAEIAAILGYTQDAIEKLFSRERLRSRHDS